MTNLTANKIFSFILSGEPGLGDAVGSSVFDAIKDEDEDSPYDTETWADIADLALEAYLELEAHDDEKEEVVAALDAIRTDEALRSEVGRLMLKKATEIKARDAANE